jgi:hypothetical protein
VHRGGSQSLKKKDAPMTILWIIVAIVALIALFWVISRRRGST